MLVALGVNSKDVYNESFEKFFLERTMEFYKVRKSIARVRVRFVPTRTFWEVLSPQEAKL